MNRLLLSKKAFMFKLYQRYLAAHFVPPFLFSTLFFVAFLLTFQLFRVMRVVIGKSVELMTILELMGHIAISFFPMAIPISILFAAIYTMNRFSEDSEVVAMRSFGASKFQLFLPFFVVTLLVALMLFSLNRSLIPQSRAQFRNTLIVLSSQGMLSDVKPEQFYMEIPGVTLFAETVDEGGDRFGDVFIVFSDSGGDQEQVITARTGTLIKQFSAAEDGWATPNLRMHLTNGNITKTFRSKDDVEVVHFDEYDFPIATEFFRPSTIARDSMRTNRELRDLIKYREEKLSELVKLQESGELPGERQHEVKNLQDDLDSSRIEFWTRFNIPLQCLVFILLGFSLGIKQGRGRSRNSGALSVAIVISYYAIFFSGVSLTQRGILPPIVTSFLPTLVALFIGGHFYRKVDWLS